MTAYSRSARVTVAAMLAATALALGACGEETASVPDPRPATAAVYSGLPDAERVAAAAAFLQRCVALTDDPERRGERALAAAQASFQAGAFDAALALLASSTTTIGPPTPRPSLTIPRASASPTPQAHLLHVLRVARATPVASAAARTPTGPGLFDSLPHRRR